MNTSQFHPYLLSHANTLDVVTQSVSMVSIMLAQYVYATNLNSEGSTGQATATVTFVGSNILLILIHARLVAAPLYAQLRLAVSRAKAVGNTVTRYARESISNESNQLDNL